MRLTVIRLAGPIVGAAACLAAPAAAREGAAGMSVPGVSSEIDYRVPLPIDTARRHGVAAHWDGSALYLSLDHRRVGSKEDDLRLVTTGPWMRRYALRGRYEHEISPDLFVSVGGELGYAKSGAVAGPLLTTRTASFSHELGLALAAPGIQLSLSHFRLGGWEQAPIGALANRMANGEGPTRYGMAVETHLGGAGDRDGFRLRLENGTSGVRARDSRALISWSASF